MATYIKNKKIETSKSNDIKNFEGIGKVAWDLISFIYEARWDSLIANNHRNSFRQKVSYKFTSHISPEKHDKKQKTLVNKLTSIKRLPSQFLQNLPKRLRKY